jgi:hypothetical protein
LDLINKGWSLPEIDGMDILFYLEIVRFANKEKAQKSVAIDEVGFL